MADELTEQLRRWGYFTVNRIAVNDDGPSGGDSVLAKKRNEAPGTRENFERELVPRGGQERRRLMAKRSGLKIAIVPIWAVDPVPARNDADAPHDRATALVELEMPDELRWIDRAMSQMARANLIRALCLREEFCSPGTHERKAAAVADAYGGRFTVRQYRGELKMALEWMRGRMAA